MKRDEKKQLKKKQVLSALLALLASDPLEVITADQICEKAQVSKRTLYSYYSSKDEIYLALVLGSFEKLRGQMEVVETGPEENSDDWIVALGRCYLKFIMDNQVMGKVIVEFDEMRYNSQYPDRTKAIRCMANSFELYALFKEKGLDTDRYTKALALLLWSQVQGLAQLLVHKGQWLEDYYDNSIDGLIEQQMSLLKRSVLNENI